MYSPPFMARHLIIINDAGDISNNAKLINACILNVVETIGNENVPQEHTFACAFARG